MSDRTARAALSRLSEPGDVRLSVLVGRLGANRVYELLREEQDVEGVYTDVAARLRDLEPEREIEEAAAQGIRFVCPGDDEWPRAVEDLDRVEPLMNRGGTPLGLWVRGSLRLDEVCRRSVAVVGSRSATTYGAGVASDIAAHVSHQGMTVVSGAAFGIDQAAHRGALASSGVTVAVLACGVDRAYPAAHRNLLDYIADTGLVVSELPPGCSPTRVRFLSRNRVIAALTQGTLIVEAAVRSGALNTANWAGRLNRVLMGVPGPVTSAPSQGVHELIRARGASLVTRGEDVLELLSPSGSFLSEAPRGPVLPEDRLSDREMQALDAVPMMRPASPDSIARTAGLAPEEVSEILARLQKVGLAERTTSGWRRAAQVPPG
ncbi:MAG TPA: DNA-processing protein DprA [Nocardioidaceae bacterium]|nr:DNA-processing protein DprA [Nocardioidaceae bacterium]